MRILFLLILSLSAYSQEPPTMPEGVEGGMPNMGMMGKPEKEEYETIEEFLEDGEYELIDGFLKLYKETEKDKYYLELADTDLNKEFIYFAYVLNGPQAAGVTGGAIGDGAILEFRKFKDRLGLYKNNTNFSNETDNNIAKADLTNIFDSFLSDFTPVVEEEGRYLISADKLFLSEMLTSVSPNLPPEYRDFVDLNLGNLDKSKTYVNQVRNYEKNTAVEVNFGFFNPAPRGREPVYAVADIRYNAISARHLFVEMPDANFEPRVADQRVGYFSQRVTDLSTYDLYPQRDLINKWRLVKKDPTAELSEPVEPIVFWVEKSTPEEIKPFVVKGIEGWNSAFEKAGFKNAIVAKIQPDDSDWDAGDVRYNVVRWSSSPRPSFSGYGPSIGNPRTGELIAADIVQEFNAIKRGYQYRKIWGWTPENDPLEQWIVSLTLHEVGHTLGLRHNFAASYLYNATEIHNAELTGEATIGSVMDYDPINLAPPGLEQGRFFPTAPGPYDEWAVEFGYKPNLTGVERDELLALSVLGENLYGTDGDAMSSPGRNIDPRVKRYDMSSEVVEYTKGRFQVLDNKIAELPSIFNDEGETKNDFANTFFRLVREKGRFMDAVSRQIGGVYATKVVNGQDGIDAYIPVSYANQKEAMNLIVDQFLSNGVWTFDPSILKNLQREKRATSYGGDGNEDPQLHSLVLGMQTRVLAHVLNPAVMTRLVDSAEYGNTYMPEEVLADLFNGIFVKGEVPDTYKRNLQSKYVDALIGAMSPPAPRGGPGGGRPPAQYDEIAKVAIYNSLIQIQKFAASYRRDPHFAYLNWKVDNFFDQ